MLDLKIENPLQQQLYDEELKYWGLFDIGTKLDKKLVTMLESEPVMNPDWTQKPLETWRRLGPLDLNEVNEISPIDLSSDLVYQEEHAAYGKGFGQFKNGFAEGIFREVHSVGYPHD